LCSKYPRSVAGARVVVIVSSTTLIVQALFSQIKSVIQNVSGGSR